MVVINKQMDTLISRIKHMNKNNSILNFEFLQNLNDLSEINKYYNKEGLKDIEFSDFTEHDFNYLYDQLFWIDFYSILKDQINDYIQSHYIYDNNLTIDNLTAFRKIYYNETYSNYLYNHILNDGCGIQFKILHDYGSSQFKTFLEIQHDYIYHGFKENDYLSVINNHSEEFDFEQDIFDINKENLKKIALIFLNNINKFDITSVDIYNSIYSEAPENTDTLSYFLSLNYTKDKIKEKFYPEKSIKNQDLGNQKYQPLELKEHKKEDNRSFFVFNDVYFLSLSNDLSYKLPDFVFETYYNSLQIMMIDKDYIELYYTLKIQDNNLILSNKGIELFRWDNIKLSCHIKEEIINYIESDLTKMFKKESHLDKFEQKIKDFFKNIYGVSINLPNYSEMSFQDIINKEILVTISCGNEKLKRNFHLQKTNFQEDNELNSFKEKIIIKNEIGTIQNIEIKNKKRI